MIDGNHLLFTQEGTLPVGGTRILGQTPLFDHCTMTIPESAPTQLADRFVELLLAMSYDDPARTAAARPRGTDAVAGRKDQRLGPLNAAVDESGFYNAEGEVTMEGYEP